MYVVGSKIWTNSWSNSWTSLIWIRNYLFVFRYMECMEFRDICMGYFKMVTVRQPGNKNWIECLGSRFKIIGMSIVDSGSVILEVYRYYEFQSSANSDLNFRERRELREFLAKECLLFREKFAYFDPPRVLLSPSSSILDRIYGGG